MLYADDTVVFGIDEKDFQNSLDMFYKYSELWHLTINFDKTKIMIFGTHFSRKRHCHQTKKHNVEQAIKAMYVLFKRIRNLNIPIELLLYLFDRVILPVALYGCEIWGFEKRHMIENLHNNLLRQIIGLRKSTPIYMLHAELGHHPIQIDIKSRMIGFWLSIVNGKESKLSKLLYTRTRKGFLNF